MVLGFITTVGLGEIFYTLLSHNVGNSVDDLKWNYTIDQIYFFYEQTIKEKMNKEKMSAVIAANAAVFATPAQDKSSAVKKERNWNTFLDLLDFDKLKEKHKKKSRKEIVNIFGLLGIPIKDQPKDDE